MHFRLFLFVLFLLKAYCKLNWLTEKFSLSVSLSLSPFSFCKSHGPIVSRIPNSFRSNMSSEPTPRKMQSYSHVTTCLSHDWMLFLLTCCWSEIVHSLSFSYPHSVFYLLHLPPPLHNLLSAHRTSFCLYPPPQMILWLSDVHDLQMEINSVTEWKEQRVPDLMHSAFFQDCNKQLFTYINYGPYLYHIDTHICFYVCLCQHLSGHNYQAPAILSNCRTSKTNQFTHCQKKT